jgi:phosphate transport system protein
MLKECLNAVVHLDTHLARKVLQDDDDIDERHRQLYSLLRVRMEENPDHIESEMNLLSVSRYLERIADLATNIAEDVVFMVDGDVIRHRSW